jgi:divalent metal cation (Fe/Co/Zn/Cd) transporter
VALAIFALGGATSFYEGLIHLRHPTPLRDPTWNYVVLGASLVLEGIGLTLALQKFRATMGDQSLWRAVRGSKDPATIAVLFENLAAIVGLVIAFLGIFIGHWAQSPYPDAVASICIGVLLGGVALLLASETRELLTGESADPSTLASIRALAESDPAVERIRRPLTMQLGPEQVLLNLDIQFREGLSAIEVEAAVDRLEEKIRSKHPQIRYIFIEAEAISGRVKEQRARAVSASG